MGEVALLLRGIEVGPTLKGDGKEVALFLPMTTTDAATGMEAMGLEVGVGMALHTDRVKTVIAVVMKVLEADTGEVMDGATEEIVEMVALDEDRELLEAPWKIDVVTVVAVAAPSVNREVAVQVDPADREAVASAGLAGVAAPTGPARAAAVLRPEADEGARVIQVPVVAEAAACLRGAGVDQLRLTEIEAVGVMEQTGMGEIALKATVVTAVIETKEPILGEGTVKMAKTREVTHRSGTENTLVTKMTKLANHAINALAAAKIRIPMIRVMRMTKNTTPHLVIRRTQRKVTMP